MPRFQFLQRGRDLARAWTDSALVGEFLERRDRDLEDFLQRVPRTLGFVLFTGPNNEAYSTDRVMTGLSLAVPFEDNRRIKVTVTALLINDASAGRIIGTVRVGGGTVGRWSDVALASGYGILDSNPVICTPARGLLTVAAHLQKNTGGGTVAVNSGTAAYLLVEDIGPA